MSGEKVRTAPDNCQICNADIKNESAIKIMDGNNLWICVKCANEQLWGDFERGKQWR